ncbi:aminoglycoside phosphotransferase family protein [Streptomyces mirabilis]|uniref:aminoglycoside phosphotransferase family protein n=1 Tax=Streptomyces mirabilis TaxID=68239 RepID=UPI003696BFF7
MWLKLTPDPVIVTEEAEALRAWAGTPSVVTMLAQELGEGALLLESVEPGVPVRELAWRLPEVAVLLRELRAPCPTPARRSVLRPLSHRIGFLFELTGRRLAGAGESGLFDSALLGRARTAALELAASGPVGLVHGELHTEQAGETDDARRRSSACIGPTPGGGLSGLSLQLRLVGSSSRSAKVGERPDLRGGQQRRVLGSRRPRSGRGARGRRGLRGVVPRRRPARGVGGRAVGVGVRRPVAPGPTRRRRPPPVRGHGRRSWRGCG